MAVAWYVLEVAHRLLDVREVREVQIHATPQWRPHLFEMKVGNQRIVVALIFAFCLMALPHSEASGCRSEISESMAVRNQTTDNKQAQDANPESLEKLVERAQVAMCKALSCC